MTADSRIKAGPPPPHGGGPGITAVLGPTNTGKTYLAVAQAVAKGFRPADIAAGFQASVAATLAELQTPIDVVDVFRRPDALMDHLDDLLAMSPLPKCVWLQSGIRNDAFAVRLESAGIAVVQDRCLMVEHRRLFG